MEYHQENFFNYFSNNYFSKVVGLKTRKILFGLWKGVWEKFLN